MGIQTNSNSKVKHSKVRQPTTFTKNNSATVTPQYHVLGTEDIDKVEPVSKNTQNTQLVYLSYFTFVLCAIIVVLQLAFCIFVAVVKAKSAPLYDGQFPAGIRAKLNNPDVPPIIERDANQVIHITAANERDLLFAQGVAMAQERLWQMDFQRRVGKGQVSEVVGPGGLGIDRLMRSLNIHDSATSDALIFSADTSLKLRSFTDGINAYINNNPPLSIEFWLLGYTPQEFKIEDVVVTIKVLAWTLDGNLNSELTRYIMTLNGIPTDRITKVLFPSYPETSPTVINKDNTPTAGPTRKLFSTEKVERDTTIGAYIADEATVRSGPHKLVDNSDMDRFLPGISHTSRSVQASNNWVIGGAATDSTKPLLACDTHLSISALGHFLLMHLRVDATGKYSTPKIKYEIDVIGAALVGAPTIVLGRNGNGVAWGMTNVAADVKDFFVLEENARKDAYIVNNREIRYTYRNVTIKVKDYPDEILTIKQSRFGTVMNNAMNLPGEKPLALKWMGTTYKNDRTVETFLQLMKVSNYDQFREAFRNYVGPAQNYIYADINNNIGYLLPGKFPTRIGGYSGEFPVLGNGQFDWSEENQYPSFDSLPFSFLTSDAQKQVKEPFFFSANNKAFPDNKYGFTVASDWLVDDYRAVRILQLITEKTIGGRKMLFSDMEEMQLDTKSSIFHRHKNILDRMGPITEGKYARDAERFRLKLLDWNGDTVNNKETTVFEEWIFNLATLAGKEVNLTFIAPNHEQDPSTLELQRFYSHRYVFGVIEAEIRNTNSSIEKNCVPYGGCLKFAKQMFSLSVSDLKERFGNVPTWGELIHWTVFDHPVFSKVPALQCVSCRRVYTKGGTQTLNVAPPNLGMSRFASNFGATYRQLIDLQNPENSLFIAPMGQSGNMLSQYYDNYLRLWKKGWYVPMKMKGYVAVNTVTF